MLTNHLNPELRDLMLREITLERLQKYPHPSVAVGVVSESIDKTRDVLSSNCGQGRIGG